MRSSEARRDLVRYRRLFYGQGIDARGRDWAKEAAVPPPGAAARQYDVAVPRPSDAYYSAHLVPTLRGWVLDADKGTSLYQLERTSMIVIPGLRVLGTFGGAVVAAFQ